MKKLIAVLGVIVALGVAVGSCAPAPEATPAAPAGPSNDLGGREVRMAVENAYPPFNMIDESGEAVGWDYDVGRALCEKLNCTPVFVEAAWEGVFEAMAAG
ncbi:MAG TPA: transporter substrate-binding domain-containing protein, partial [Chloroflexi bacterium]|nr:transporter substrate-binding domain-containing protein [Chloroflexota bacterium]